MTFLSCLLNNAEGLILARDTGPLGPHLAARPEERLPLPVDERDHGGKDLLVQAGGHALHTLHARHLEPCSGEERRVGIPRSGPCLGPGTSLLALEDLPPTILKSIQKTNESSLKSIWAFINIPNVVKVVFRVGK